MSKKLFATNKRNPCPVCGVSDGRCRATDTELVLCMSVLDGGSTPQGWKFIGLSNGGGDWGKIVPANQPEGGNWKAKAAERAAERAAVESARLAKLKPKTERDKAFQLNIETFTLRDKGRAELASRGLNDEDIQALTPYSDLRGGYVVPIRDMDGLMVGGQRKPADGRGYRWITTGLNHIKETNELPLAHWGMDSRPEMIVLAEGTGVKPYLAAKRMRAIAIGASGGQFTCSSKTLKATLDRYSDLPVVFALDAGVAVDKKIIRKFAATRDLIKSWGREDVSVLWWGQIAKRPQGEDRPKTEAEKDIDEICPDTEVQTISWIEFLKIATNANEAATPFLNEAELEGQHGNNGGGSGGGSSKPSQADIAIAIAKQAIYFHTPDKAAYADVRVDGIRQTMALRSRAYRLWLSLEYHRQTGCGLSSSAYGDALNTMEAIAIAEGEEKEVFLRVASHQGKNYIDLGSKDWTAVEVDGDGWRVVAEPPVRFWRPESMLPLPVPTMGGNLKGLKELINVTDASWPLVATNQLYCMIPQKTYPVMVIHAPRGAGKTSSAEILKGLIDPGKAPLIKLSADTYKLAVAASNRLMMVYDNVSSISAEQSDDLCRVATNFGFSTRTLFTTGEETTIELRRPQIITAIDALVTRDDLADRVLMVVLEAIAEDKRLSQAGLSAKVKEASPRIFGALLTALAKTLRQLPSVDQKELPRMADYALFSIAAEQALGKEIGLVGKGSFLGIFGNSRETAREVVLEASSIGSAIIRMVAGCSDIKKLGQWTGTATDLLNELEKYTDDSEVRSRFWPKASNTFKRQLNRLIPDLGAMGIEVKESIYNGIKKITVCQNPGWAKISTPSTPDELKSIQGNDFSGVDSGVDGVDTSGFGVDTLSGIDKLSNEDMVSILSSGVDKVSIENIDIDTRKDQFEEGFQPFGVDGVDIFTQPGSCEVEESAIKNNQELCGENPLFATRESLRDGTPVFAPRADLVGEDFLDEF